MHEIKIASDLSRIVLEVASKEKLSKVTAVNISFGQLIRIVPDIFKFAFRETVRNTVSQDAEIRIEILPVKMKCVNCHSEFVINDNTFVCNSCGSAELEIIQGTEMFIKSMEGE